MTISKKFYSIHEAKTSLSKLIQRALRGEEIVIGKRNTPLVTLNIITPTKVTLGRFTGKIKISSDFDTPLEDFKEYM